MARIEVATHIAAEPARVWDVVVDWESQPRWMVDARSVTVLSSQREGVGVVLRCRSGYGPVVLSDDMATTEWQPPRLLGVRHVGRVIRGVGAFELQATSRGTRLLWWEEIDAGFGGFGEAVAQILIVPLVTRVFRRSLANLKRVCESPNARAQS